DDLFQSRQRQLVLAAELFGERGNDLLEVLFLETRRRNGAGGLFGFRLLLAFFTLFAFRAFLALGGLIAFLSARRLGALFAVGFRRLGPLLGFFFFGF